MASSSTILWVLVMTVPCLSQVISGKDLTPIHKKGYCVWYGQLTIGGKAKNCPYNGPAKNVTDPEAKKILEELCPELKGGPTCCDVNQLKSLTMYVQVLKQIAGHCPACWDNLRRLFCMSTCSPDQSKFMDAKQILGFPPVQWIEDVQYFVSPEYKQGLFDSCKDVVYPGNNEKFLSLFCGTTAEKCTPQKLLDYIGNPSNGMAPFSMEYPQMKPTGWNITWMDSVVRRCDKPFLDPVSGKPSRVCDCDECRARRPCLYRRIIPARPVPSRVAQLTIRSTHPVKTGYRRYPDDKFIPFGPIFHMYLLDQSLDLQLTLTNLQVPYDGSNISLKDVCTKPKAPHNKNCLIESLFQYFQNNITLLHKCKTSMGYDCSDQRKDFFYADFHDHVIYCSNAPSSKDPKFRAPCLGLTGQPVAPELILSGYPKQMFQEAPAVIIRFVLDIGEEIREKTEAWKKGFMSYMETYVADVRHSNLTITFSAGKEL